MKSIFPLLSWMLWCYFGLLNPAHATRVIHVPGDSATIQSALKAADYGDTVKVGRGIFNEIISMKNGVVLTGVSPEQTILSIDSCSVDAIITCGNCDKNTVISNLTINGAARNDCEKEIEPIGILSLNSDVKIVNNRIINHYRSVYDSIWLAQYEGHGIYVLWGAPYIAFNHIENNRAYRLGGGIISQAASPVIEYNVFAKNQVFNWGPDVRGAGLGITGGAPRISHNIFYKNQITGNFPNPAGGGIYIDTTAQPLYIGNNAFVGNTPDAMSGQLKNIVYNAFYDNGVETDSLGEGNIFADPQFVDAEIGDFHLQKCSPLIDAGDPGLDFASESIPNGNRINIGRFGNTSEATWSAKPDLGPDIVGCWGEGVTLEGNEVFDDFEWSNGHRTQDVLVRQSRSYILEGKFDEGCSGFDTIDVSFGLDMPLSVQITVNKQSLYAGEAAHFEAIAAFPGKEVAYQWQVNEQSVGATDKTFVTRSLKDGDQVRCIVTSSGRCATNNPAFSDPITLYVNEGEPYYHPMQNFDDDVDRIKTFSNFLGGNNGLLSSSPSLQNLRNSYDTTATRTGHGRSLKMEYGPLFKWGMYVESFQQSWFDTAGSLDLYDLFPGFESPQFENRRIDSLVFYARHEAKWPLTLKVELHDVQDNISFHWVYVDTTNQWQRFAVALDDFLGCADLRKSKFLGFVFDESPKGRRSNFFQEGVLFLDDIYLVERRYKKPTFADHRSFLEYVNEVSFRHFWTAIDPASKLALDRNIWPDLISLDAVGFQLSSYVIAHQNEWVDPKKIEDRIQEILYNLLYRCRHSESVLEVTEHPLEYATLSGNWAHFLDPNGLTRKDDTTPYSLITNAQLLAGVVTAGAYFAANDSIRTMADRLFAMTDWTFLYIPEAQTMFYEWTPEKGFSGARTDWFSEFLDLAFLLGVSSPEPAHRLPENPYLSPAYRKPLNADSSFVYTSSGSGSNYFSLQLYAPFSHDSGRHQNARMALLRDLESCRENYADLGYDPRIFGTAACEGPDSAGVSITSRSDTLQVSNFHTYGYCPRRDVENGQNGTVAVYGSGATLSFVPDEAIRCLQYYYEELDPFFQENYQYPFWSSLFGFPDAFHLAPDEVDDPLVSNLRFRGPWLSVPRFSIDLGPMMIGIHNYLSEQEGGTSIRELFAGYPQITDNLDPFASILSTEVSTLSAEITASRLELCEGEPVTFTVSAQNQGPRPVYRWLINGIVLQEGGVASFTTDQLQDLDTVQCVVVSSEHCFEGQVALSNEFVLRVYDSAGPKITGTAEACWGEEVLLQVEGDFVSCAWSQGWEGSGPCEVAVNQPGLYVVAVTDENGCHYTDSVQVVFYDLPVARILGDQSLCVGASMALSLDAEFPKYEWSTGEETRSILIERPDLYRVDFTDENGCMGSDSIEVTGDIPPAIVISGDLTVCEGEEAQLDAGLGYDAYMWSDGTTGRFTQVRQSGSYSVTVIDRNGCFGADTVSLIEQERPTPAITGQTSICQGEQTQLLVTTDYQTYRWSNGMEGPQMMTSQPGRYSVLVTASNGCTGTDTVEVSVYDLPLVAIQGERTFCEGSNAVLWVDPRYSSYRWSVNLSTPEITVGEPGVYAVSVTNEEGCSVVDSVEVYRMPTTTLHTSLTPVDTTLCAGEFVRMIASAGVDSSVVHFRWELNGMLTDHANDDLLYRPLLPKNQIRVIATADMPCVVNNPDTSRVSEVSFKPLAEVKLLPENSDIMVNDTVFLVGEPPGGIFAGTFVENDLFIPSESGTYRITYSFPGDEVSCANDASREYLVSPAVGIVQEADHVEIGVYPNPSKGLVHVTWKGIRDQIDIQLADAAGRVVWTQALDSILSEGDVEMNGADMPAGFYWLKFVHQGRIYTFRLIFVD